MAGPGARGLRLPAILAALLLPWTTTGAAADPTVSATCAGGTPALLVAPRPGDGYIVLARRYADREGRWRAIRDANRRRPVQAGRKVQIPLEMVDPEHLGDALRALFPEDRLEAGIWIHVVGRGPGARCREDAAFLARWFTGRTDLASDIARLNGLPDGPLPVGRSVRLPQELLHPSLSPAGDRRDGLLSFGEDEQGPFALYRLRPGEALYSAVVVRFTGRMDADEVNELADRVAARSGIDDVRDIPIGFPVKIPRDLLLPQHLPAGDPARMAYEAERRESERHRIEARARRLAGVHVILDSGHGGVDVGATRSGLDEDEYVYDILCRVKRTLERDTDAMVLTLIEDLSSGHEPQDLARLPRDHDEVIRTTPPFAPQERDGQSVAVNLRWYLANSFYRRLVARGVDPDKIVMVSLHADSLHPTLSGAMVYIPGEEYRRRRYGFQTDRYAEYAEAREQAFVSFNRDLRVRSEGVSRQFADHVIRVLAAGDLPVHRYLPVRDHVIRGRRSWVPAVIRCSEVPVSVLVEVANLNNAEDRRRLQDPSFREAFARAFAEALVAFYAPAADAAALHAAGSR